MKWVLTMPEIDIHPRGQLLDHERVRQQRLAESAVLLGDGQPEQAHLLHTLDDAGGYASACSSRCACGMISFSTKARARWRGCLR